MKSQLLHFSKTLWENRHKYLMFFWIAMIIPSVLWWSESVIWVILLSLYANIEVSAAALEAKKGKGVKTNE